MNVFFLDDSPDESAKMMIDKHVNKMIVETAQLLANAYSVNRLSEEDCPKTQKGNSRKYSYYNHPCSIWTRKSQSNFDWLLKHGLALLKERRVRFNKDHFCRGFLEWCDKISPQINDVGLTSPAQAFKRGVYDHLIDEDNPVLAYRKYYCTDKRFDNRGKWMATYTNRNFPSFWKELLSKDEYSVFLVENHQSLL